MATLVFSENDLLSVVCSSKFKIVDCSDGSCKFSGTLSDFKPPQNTKKPKKTSNDNDNKQDMSLGHGNVSSFSPSGRLYSLCTPDKVLVLWRTDTWECLSRRTIEKKATAIAYTSDEEYVVVADKAGDVYKFSIKDSGSKGIFVLGHISMITDMVLTTDNKYIITADRDEKIRVSHFPNSHSIATYCLGHTDFVSSIKVLSQYDILVSSGGDGSVIFWDFKAGKKLCTKHPQENIDKHERSENLEEKVTESEVISCIACCKKKNIVCVIIENSCVLHFFHVTSNGTVLDVLTLSISVYPWHITFDSTGLLWCLLPNPEEPVVIFKQEETSEIIQFVKVESFNDLPMYDEVNEWSYLEECVGKEPQLSLLRKRTDVDNMKEYLTRKEERLQQKKARLEELESKKSKRVKVQQ